MDLRQLQGAYVCFPTAHRLRPETVRPQNVTELRMMGDFHPHEAVRHRLPPPVRLEIGKTVFPSKPSGPMARKFTNRAADALRVVNV
jgi:hypothetical protein